ncbi:S8 family serine peptidase [Microbacterium sp. MAH-37]|nr:S8 family serine peptidase [Microbacterium sp. MAH-37]
MVAVLAVASTLAVAGSTAATAASGDGGADGADGTSASPSGDAARTRVTLITGDKVDVLDGPDGRILVDVIADDDSTGPVAIEQIGGDTYAVPEVADQYLVAGALDRELFNVSELVEYGYDDAHGGIPLIAQYDPRLRAKPAPLAGATTARSLPSIGGAALQTDADQADLFWKGLTTHSRARGASTALGGGISKLWLDGKVEATLDKSVPLVGAPEAWAQGLDGTGATVAVLDSGVDAGHPDLATAIDATESFVPGEEVTDRNGHGTHVASTVAGSGAASDGRYKGVAPGANLLIGKVLGDNGTGQDSWIIAGMEWASSHARVVSMSLGDSSRTDQTDPIAQSLNALARKNDTLFVVAAGNSGGVATVDSPGTADEALTVAATDDNDKLADFSSRGPRGIDDALKPDISAPGVNIMAARSQYITGSGFYRSLNGTSMATPHVSGAAAILAAAHPDWDRERLKASLMSSSKELAAYSVYEVGTGRLDIPRALDGVDATGSVYFGKAKWGEDDPAPQTRTIRYWNDGDAAKTLTLAATSADGPSPVTLSAPTVTVPARGTATVDVRYDFADLTAAGHDLGQVIATDESGAPVARTTTGATREDERYDLDVTVIGADGEPIAAEVDLYRYGTTDMRALESDGDTGAVKTQRVAPGVYSAMAWVEMPVANGRAGRALLSAPHIAVTDDDAHITLDARDARPISVQTPKPSVELGKRIEWFHDSGLGGELSTYYYSLSVDPSVQLYASPTGDVAGGRYDFAVRWTLSAPYGDIRAYAPGVTAFTPQYQQGSPRLDGRVDVRAVAAGTGSAEEYAGVDVGGKAAIVTNDPSVTPGARAQAAKDAGATMLVVVNDRPGVLFAAAGSTTLPVVSVPAEQGAALLNAAESGALRLKGDAVRNPDYGYDLVQHQGGGITADLAWTPKPKELAGILDRFVDDQVRDAALLRYDCPDYLIVCQSSGIDVRTQDERTVWVTPGTAYVSNAADVSGWNQLTGLVSYPANRTTTHTWFGTANPHTGSGYADPWAAGTQMRMLIQPASGAGDIAGNGSGKLATRLFQNGKLLRSGAGAIQMSVPAATGVQQYRYELDTTRDGAIWANSTTTKTVWSFGYDQADARGELPLVQIGFDLPTDLTGTATLVAGASLTVGVHAWQLPDAARGGTVANTTLEVSYDGGSTWTDAVVSNGSASITPPEGATSVSLRAAAGDDHGNTVTQTVIHAFGLR